MTGELEYNDLYYPQKEYITFNISDFSSVSQSPQSSSSSPPSPGVFNATIHDRDIQQIFPFTAHLVLSVFILAVAIVIMNLLFGMAVSDVQELYKKSRLHQSIQQVHLISYMEGLMRSPLFLRLPTFVQEFFRRRLHGLEGRYRNVCEIEPDSYDDKKLLPQHLNKTIKEKCVE